MHYQAFSAQNKYSLPQRFGGEKGAADTDFWVGHSKLEIGTLNGTGQLKGMCLFAEGVVNASVGTIVRQN